MICEVQTEGILRPSPQVSGRGYIDRKLKEGWNQFFIKIMRKEESIRARFVIASFGSFYHRFTDLIECKFPWEL